MFHLWDVTHIQAFWLSLKNAICNALLPLYFFHVRIGCAAKHMLNRSLYFICYGSVLSMTIISLLRRNYSFSALQKTNN
jgi:hypothetical protein